MKLDFFLRHKYMLSSLAPIWKNFPSEYRGVFHVGVQAMEAVTDLLGTEGIVRFEGSTPSGNDPILSASYGDMARAARNTERKLVLMQHGIGHTFGMPAYADGSGRNNDVDLWLAPNDITASKIRSVRPANVEVIGVPKADSYSDYKGAAKMEHLKKLPAGKKPVIAIAFHWGDKNSNPPESGSAWEYYRSSLDRLKSRYELIGHDHPLAPIERRQAFESAGVEFVPSWDDVRERADIYVNDLSSTIYEFLLTGKPVVLLNAPWFRRDVDFGIRFWDYSDVGINVEGPRDIVSAIDRTIEEYETIKADQRIEAMNELFPHQGGATQRAVAVLVDYLDRSAKEKKKVAHDIRVMPADIGVIYMCFGNKALTELQKSVKSLRRMCGDVPVTVVGSTKAEGLPFIEWRGESPFDRDGRENFKFMAGRVKPFLFDLSPYKRTLYMDVDTIIEQDVRCGFDYLLNWDFAIAQERHSILELYNVQGGKWHHDMKEREATIAEFGGNGNFPFLNSGVFFWRKNERTQTLFENWHLEWLRFQQWDEQAALMRAINKTMVKVLTLAETWNFPHRNGSKMPPVITHLYGRGGARSNDS